MITARILMFAICAGLAGCGAGEPISLPPPDGFSQDPIPAAFRHVWAREIADCSLRNGLSRMTIDPATISFANGRFDVTSLREIDGAGIEINIRAFSGPQQRHTLELADNAETLIYRGSSDTQTFHRCQRTEEPARTLAVLQ